MNMPHACVYDIQIKILQFKGYILKSLHSFR